MIQILKKNTMCFFLALLLTPLIVLRIFQSISIVQMFIFSIVMIFFCNMVNKQEPSFECITLFFNLIIATSLSEYFPKQGLNHLFLIFMSCLVAHSLASSLANALFLSVGVILGNAYMAGFDYIQIIFLFLFTALFFISRYVSFYAINYFTIPTQTLFDRQIAILLSLLYFYMVVVVFLSLWHNLIWILDNQSYEVMVCNSRNEFEIFLTYTAMLFSHGTFYAVQPISRSAILLSTVTMALGMLMNVFYAGIVIAYVFKWRENRNRKEKNEIF